jgi:hypothetical protein
MYRLQIGAISASGFVALPYQIAKYVYCGLFHDVHSTCHTKSVHYYYYYYYLY